MNSGKPSNSGHRNNRPEPRKKSGGNFLTEADRLKREWKNWRTNQPLFPPESTYEEWWINELGKRELDGKTGYER